MPLLRNNYGDEVAKNVLELFKKVLQVKNDKENEIGSVSKQQEDLQIGGSAEEMHVSDSSTQDIIKLTKVEQYYDGMIYEGTINNHKKYNIEFNIKDRTNGHHSK